MFMSNIHRSAAPATFRALGGLRRRCVMGLAVTLVTACAIGVATDNAKAIAFGPNLRGSGSGWISCEPLRHQLTFHYQATPEWQTIISGGVSRTTVAPYVIEVASYVKPAGTSSWVLMSDNTAVLDSKVTKDVTWLTVPARGYWEAGFYVRAAPYPGGRWSQWYWEAAPPYMSLSGNGEASYGYCAT